ncbi:hypothetical protein [Fastidiosibacter lacustris]|uniref:hypothetical protein n=1 Tax=Fastidiosibacter lacustris TaxID=2056695 RepID=UPI000E347E0B|nr:hypothetical protein [Fastidiosibacter lacustris]
MKKVAWLILICALAVLGSLSVLYHPGVVAFFVDDTLIKLPLWLFIVIIVVGLTILGFVYHLLKVVVFTPRHWWQTLHMRKKKKLNILLVEMQKAYLLQDQRYIDKHKAQAKLDTPEVGEGLTMLYWQSLYDAGKYKELQSILLALKRQMELEFIWRYYQAMIFVKVAEYGEALALLQGLIEQEPRSKSLIHTLIICQIEQKQSIIARNTIVKYQHLFSLDELNHYFEQILMSVVSYNDLSEIWQGLPKRCRITSGLDCVYFKRLAAFVPLADFREQIQKELTHRLRFELVLLYLNKLKDQRAYEFIKACWLKQNDGDLDQLNLLLLTQALVYQDWEFMETHIDRLQRTKLTTQEEVKYLLLRSKFCEHQSMPNQAHKLLAEVEQLLLELK